ncbi:IS3 family transposase [Brevibacillus sp. FSL K6-0770]|uniref:IS3 family transposase n=1 Tax=Brevibacillus sp. FSL K6-0770 TaxID=2954673 RepID=UPI004046ED67
MLVFLSFTGLRGYTFYCTDPDNACIESFFSHLKAEMMYRCSAKSLEELNHSFEKYTVFYNQNRFQKKLGDRSPIEYREAIAA